MVEIGQDDSKGIRSNGVQLFSNPGLHPLMDYQLFEILGSCDRLFLFKISGEEAEFCRIHLDRLTRKVCSRIYYSPRATILMPRHAADPAA